MDKIAVVVPPSQVDSVRHVLKELKLNDSTRRLKHLQPENKVAVPIISETNNTVLTSIHQLESILAERTQCEDIEVKNVRLAAAKKANILPPEQRLKRDLRKLVESHGHRWTDEIEHDIPTRWERHGDLVLVPETTLNQPIWKDIGEAAWQVVCKCLSSSRLARKSVVATDGYRRPQVTLTYGNNGWVQQIDNHIKYTYDVTKCMFSSGNITEKLRVSRLDCTDEVVVDLYAGIGYFTLPYLVYTGVKHLHACEWNPDAVEALQRNLVLNKVHDRCTVHYGDNRKVCPVGVADRVNLGLIPSSRDGWPVACQALKPDVGGVLHIHFNVNTKPGHIDSLGQIESQVTSSGPGNIDNMASTELGNIDNMAKTKLENIGNMTRSKQGNIDNMASTKQGIINNVARTKLGNIDNMTIIKPGNFDSMPSHKPTCVDTMEQYKTEDACYSMPKCETEKLRLNACCINDEKPNSVCTETHLNCSSNSVEERGIGYTTKVSFIESDIESGKCETEKFDSFRIEGKIGTSGVDNYDALLKTYIEHQFCIHTQSCKVPENRTNSGKNLCDICKMTVHGLMPSNNQVNPVNGTNVEKLQEHKMKLSEKLRNIKLSMWFPWSVETSKDIKSILEHLHGVLWVAEILHIEHVKSYAPHVDHIVLDLKCSPLKEVLH